MKQVNLIKLFVVALLCVAGVSRAQYIAYPLAFGPHTLSGSATMSSSNFYKDYVGVRFEVTAPASIAGEKVYTTANDGSGAAGAWGSTVTSPLVNVPIFMDSTSDSFGIETNSAALSAGDVTSINATGTNPHKILVVWRGPLGSGAIDFACKAMNGQWANASAVVIINEYPGQGPVGMGEGTTCTPTTIPVFMIGNLDGIAISAAYRAGIPVTMTITPWGANAVHDLGIIPGGGAGWHAYAYPSNQVSANEALKQVDGAFVANFGTASASRTLSLPLTCSVYSNRWSLQLLFIQTLYTFSAATAGAATYPFPGNSLTDPDSILALFSTTEYSLTGSGNGRYDLTYNVSTSSWADDAPADNSYTYSWYTTDNIYSKGRYDFTNNKPVWANSEAFGNEGTEFLWGNMYFVGPTAGTAIQKIQYSLAQNSTSTTAGTVILNTASNNNNVFVFKWTDGTVGTGPDSLVQDGELSLVSSSVYTFDDLNDTSGALLQLTAHNPLNKNTIGNAAGDTTGVVLLDANSWYYVVVDVPPGGSSTGFFLGIDNVLDPLPRVYGRFHANGILDYNTFVAGDLTLQDGASVPTNPEFPIAAPQVSFVNAVDSFDFHGNVGLIPAIAMVVNNSPDTTHTTTTSHVGVNNVNKAPISLSLYPNPASDYLNVTVNLAQPASVVSYEIIDGVGRFVGRENHYNASERNLHNTYINFAGRSLLPGRECEWCFTDKAVYNS